jgi:hypothetical protein
MDVAPSEKAARQIGATRNYLMRKLFRALGLGIARLFGTRIIDCQTGQRLGKALIFSWGGKIHVIGLETAVRLVFLPQKRLTYWKQEIGFTTHPPPDYPNIRWSSENDCDQKTAD